MILAPLAGIILNLFDTSMNTKDNDIAGIFASMDCPDTVVCGFQYLIEYDWVSTLCFFLSYSTNLHDTDLHDMSRSYRQIPLNAFIICTEHPRFCLIELCMIW